jgi:hypothetical protein
MIDDRWSFMVSRPCSDLSLSLSLLDGGDDDRDDEGEAWGRILDHHRRQERERERENAACAWLAGQSVG